MQYTDNEAALIGGLISNYFFQPSMDAKLRESYRRVLRHLHENSPARRQAGQPRHSAGIPAGAYWTGLIRCQTSRVRPAADRPPPAWSCPDGRCTT